VRLKTLFSLWENRIIIVSFDLYWKPAYYVDKIRSTLGVEIQNYNRQINRLPKSHFGWRSPLMIVWGLVIMIVWGLVIFSTFCINLASTHCRNSITIFKCLSCPIDLLCAGRFCIVWCWFLYSVWLLVLIVVVNYCSLDFWNCRVGGRSAAQWKGDTFILIV